MTPQDIHEIARRGRLPAFSNGKKWPDKISEWWWLQVWTGWHYTPLIKRSWPLFAVIQCFILPFLSTLDPSSPWRRNHWKWESGCKGDLRAFFQGFTPSISASLLSMHPCPLNLASQLTCMVLPHFSLIISLQSHSSLLTWGLLLFFFRVN